MKLVEKAQISPEMTHNGDTVEFSVVMPCLNESATVGVCVKKALDARERHGIRGEVIVADNGSTDGSQEIGTGLGARVVPIETRGRFVLMGDADDSNNFAQLDAFVRARTCGQESSRVVSYSLFRFLRSRR
jgi:glycosyltransferase involved in cell wall biosynthesis